MENLEIKKNNRFDFHPTPLEGLRFVRQGSTDHAIYARIIDGKRYSAPVLMGKKTLDPNYCKRVFRQLKLTDQEIGEVLSKK